MTTPMHPNGAVWHGKCWEADDLEATATENCPGTLCDADWWADDCPTHGLLASQRALDGLLELRRNLWRRRAGGLVHVEPFTPEFERLLDPSVHGPGWRM